MKKLDTVFTSPLLFCFGRKHSCTAETICTLGEPKLPLGTDGKTLAKLFL